MLGACKVIPQEYLNITCRAIDVDWPTANTKSQTALIASLLHELTAMSTDPVVAYRDGVRWIQGYQPIRLALTETQPERLRHQGVYLITGGLGNVGMALAEYLAKAVQARLVLVGRSAFPRHEEWAFWLESHAPDEPTSQKIRRLQDLEAAGIEVLLCQADVAEVSQMEAVFAHVEAHFGQVHGVIHAAGITTDAAFKTMQYLDLPACEVHFQPKVYGLLALEQVLRVRPVDFCLVFSSLAAVLGGLSLAAYAAANGYMDAFVHYRNQKTNTSWISVNWDTWQFKKDTQRPAWSDNYPLCHVGTGRNGGLCPCTGNTRYLPRCQLYRRFSGPHSPVDSAGSLARDRTYSRFCRISSISTAANRLRATAEDDLARGARRGTGERA